MKARALVLSLTLACNGGSAGPPDAGSDVVVVDVAAPSITSFSVGSDETLTYPNSPSNPPYLVDLPDEHTTFIPLGPGPNDYLVFGASKISGGTGGAVALQTADLASFQFATSLGYARQVFASPVAIDQCNATYATEFDENYAAPGSVVQDPTLPAGNLMMIYEAENHCPGGTNQHAFYATVGFARSSDDGKTWPTPGDPARQPVLKGPNAQPTTSYPPMGNAIPSAFVDRAPNGDSYLYVAYNYYDGGMAPAADHIIRVARAKLGTDPLVFEKWNNGSFGSPGIGGVDEGVLPSIGCTQGMPEITRNDDLGKYLMVFVCHSGSGTGAWYYSTATSLELEDWTTPQMIQGSQGPVTQPCPNLTTGGLFDGWYPSLVSPGAEAGHTKLTGKVFFQNGCDTGQRVFSSRTFTITD